MISNEIKAAQEAYAARPFAVRWEDSHSALTNRFATLDEAYAYIFQMAAFATKNASKVFNYSTMFWRSFLETPAGRVQLTYVLLCDEVRS